MSDEQNELYLMTKTNKKFDFEGRNKRAENRLHNNQYTKLWGYVTLLVSPRLHVFMRSLHEVYVHLMHNTDLVSVGPHVLPPKLLDGFWWSLVLTSGGACTKCCRPYLILDSVGQYDPYFTLCTNFILLFYLKMYMVQKIGIWHKIRSL
jgi:hypothetical protein